MSQYTDFIEKNVLVYIYSLDKYMSQYPDFLV